MPKNRPKLTNKNTKLLNVILLQNRSAETVQIAIFIVVVSTLIFIAFFVFVMAMIRIYYKGMLEARIRDIQREHEPNRVRVVENADNEAVKIQPPPLSPPISDQTEYNVVAGALRDDRKGQLF